MDLALKDRLEIKVVKLKKFKGSLYINDSLRISTLFKLDESQTDERLSEYVEIGDRLEKKENSDIIKVIKHK